MLVHTYFSLNDIHVSLIWIILSASLLGFIRFILYTDFRLSRMWNVMFECHKLQFHIISVAYNNGNTKISIQSELHRHVTIDLVNELSSLSSSFTKWIGAQKSYLKSIDGWLLKCVPEQKHSKRKRRPEPGSHRSLGPPIYVTCGVWLEKLETLPKQVPDPIKELAAETARFVPRQERNQGKDKNRPYVPSWEADNKRDSENLLINEASDDWISHFDRFRSRLEAFLGYLNNFADYSVKMYVELEEAIRVAKIRYEKSHSQVS
jgi:hypothetical protein